MVLSAKLFGDEDGSFPYRRRGEGRIQAFLLPLKSGLLPLPCLFYMKGNEETVPEAVEAIEWGKRIEEAYNVSVEKDYAKFFRQSYKNLIRIWSIGLSAILW